MKKAILVTILIIIILILINYNQENHLQIEDERIIIELAETNKEMERGLMFRKNLCESCGMLFIFEDNKERTFWMKNVLIPLDIIFINSNLEIVKISHAEPCEEEPCRSYSSNEEVKYVLEVNVNRFNEEIIGKEIILNLN